MDHEPPLIERVIRRVDSVRQLFGLVVLLCFGVAFVVMGNALGRIVGVLLLAACVAIGISLRRRRSRER